MGGGLGCEGEGEVAALGLELEHLGVFAWELAGYVWVACVVVYFADVEDVEVEDKILPEYVEY